MLNRSNVRNDHRGFPLPEGVVGELIPLLAAPRQRTPERVAATEVEWGGTARGDLEGRRYPWGDTIGGALANHVNSGDPEDNDTNPVGSYAPNGHGIYDMAGNVNEWVQDRYDESYYPYCVDQGLVDDPQGADSGMNRVIRGGAWSWSVNDLRVSRRFSIYQADWGRSVGWCAR